MKRVLIAIEIVVLFAMVAYAQTKSVVTNFGGLSSASETDIPPGVAVDVVNFDFRTSVMAPGVSLQLRDGYLQVGDDQIGITGGPWVFRTSEVDKQLVAAFGRDLMMYDPAQDVWTQAGVHPLADTCACWASVDTVMSLHNKNWWRYSVEDYDSISIGDFATGGGHYAIRRIMGDSVIILDDADSLPSFTSAGIPCTLWVLGSLGSSEVFENDQDEKWGFMFEDTLHIISQNKKIKYGGASPSGVIAPQVFDSIGSWDSTTNTITLYGAAGLSGWNQVGPDENSDLNIALYSVARTGNSNTFRCDTTVAQWLTNNASQTWQFTSRVDPVWDTIFTSTVSTIEVDSTFAKLEQSGPPVMWYARVKLGPDYTKKAYILFNSKRYRPLYTYRWKIKTTAVSGSPEDWPLDSLDYITAYADNGAADDGVYAQQFPVTMDTTAAGDTVLCVTTYGYPGYSVTTYDTGAYYRPSDELNPACDCNNGVADCSWPDAWGPYIWIDPESPDADTARWVNKPNGYDWCGQTVDKMVVECYDSWSGYPVSGNGADNAYDASNGITLTRMVRDDRTPIGSGVASVTWATIGADTSYWAWGYCISAMGRLFCIDVDTSMSTIYWSAPNNPDSFGVADFEPVYTDDGMDLTTLWHEQNIIYAAKPLAIYSIPLTVTSDGTSIEATGAYPTRARYGPLWPGGLTSSPYGWHFIGYPGVFSFDGMDATMISSEIQWFWRDSLSSSQVQNATIAYDVARDNLVVSAARNGALENDVTLVYDFATRQWSRYDFGAHKFAVLAYPSGDPRLYWSDPDQADGRVYRMDLGLTRDEGVPINAYFRTGLLGLGDMIGARGHITEWFLESHRDEYMDVTLSVFLDGASAANLTSPLTIGYGGWQVDRTAFPKGYSGHNVQFLLNVDNGDTCNITGLRIDYVPDGTVRQEKQ